MGSQLLRMRWNISETSSLQDSKKKYLKNFTQPYKHLLQVKQPQSVKSISMSLHIKYKLNELPPKLT